MRNIIDITSQRRRLSVRDHEALGELVELELTQPDTLGLGTFQGASSLRSYFAVVVQKLYRASTLGDTDESPPRETPTERTIRQAATTLRSRDALVVKMWFESGMTTQKIATVLDMRPEAVHAVIAQHTDRVQERLAQSQTGDGEKEVG